VLHDLTIDLPIIWSGIIALAVMMYVVLDGFDLGIGILFAINRDEGDRDKMIASIAPIWDGNETWLVLGGGGLLAAFPAAYSILLPALYIPMMLMLFGLVFRGVAFEFRPNARGSRRFWDLGFWLGSVVATLAQGMALGAFITGFPETIVSSQEGSFAFLTVFNAICGIGLVAGYALLGACWLILKADGRLRERCFALAFTLGIVLAAYLAMISIWTPLAHPRVAERWFSFPNFLILAPIPLAAGFCWLNMMRSLALRRESAPFLSAIAIFILSFAGIGISVWPYIVPHILTIHDAAAPEKSQGFLLIGVIALLPLILGYTAHSYWVFRGKVTDADGYH
jgi:cytochrome d ubiquinol oxidase subunit II